MKTRLLAAAAFALCVVGILIYFAVRSDGASSKTEASADTADTADDSAQAPKRMTSDAPPPVQGPPDIAEEPDPEGPLRLEGQVVDENGTPVGGAVVWLGSIPPRSMVTEDDGSFAFEKLIGKIYRLTAKKDALVGGPVERKLTSASDPVVIRLEPGAQVAVTVTARQGGEPIEGATVVIGARDSQTTDAAGVAQFDGVRSGYAGLSASAPGYAPGDSWLEVPETPGAKLTHHVALDRGAAVSGNVVDPDGKPVSGATVVPVDSSSLYRGGRDVLTARSDKTGAFSIPAIAAGTWTFQASHKDFAPGSSELVTIDGESPATGVQIELSPGAVVAGKVVDAAQAPVPWASVRVRTRKAAAQEFGAQVRSATADENGQIEMTGLPRREVSVLAVGETASSQSIDVDLEARPETRDLTLTLDVTGKIAGVVVDSAGEPIAEAQVMATPNIWSGERVEGFELRGQSTRSTGGDGRFEFSGLPEGEYRLHASRTRGSTFWWWRQDGAIARTGTLDVQVVLQKQGALAGMVTLDNSETPESFTVTVGYPPGVPVANKRGEFSIPSLIPGTYDVTISGPEFSEHVVRGVTIAPGETKDLGTIAVERGRHVSGRVVDASGAPVPGATVAVGRQLIGDGKSLSPELGASTDQWLGVRRGRTDGDGAYRIVGIGKAKLVIAAEHPGIGRSLPAEIPKGKESVTRELRLRAFGSVAGTVTSGGKPAAGIQVAATPQGTTQQNIVVNTGDDGSFRFERLPEGTYTLMAVLGAGIGGGNFASTIVTVTGGAEQTEVTIDVVVGDIELAVTFAGKDGAHIDAAQMFWFSEPGVTADSAEDINRLFTSSGGNAKSGLSFSADKPAVLEDLTSGESSLCVLPINGNLMDPGFQKRLQESMDKLRVYCEPVTIAPSPKRQSHTAVVPAMDPLPSDSLR